MDFQFLYADEAKIKFKSNFKMTYSIELHFIRGEDLFHFEVSGRLLQQEELVPDRVERPLRVS